MWKKRCLTGFLATGFAATAGCQTPTSGPVLESRDLTPPSVVVKGRPAPAFTPSVAGCDPANKKACHIHVAVAEPCATDVNVTVDPQQLQMNRGARRIVWHLPNGYAFCPTIGDGVFVQPNADGNFTAFATSDDEDGGMSDDPDFGNCRRKFRTFNFNWGTAKYNYMLQFSRMELVGIPPNQVYAPVATCKKDPWVKNGR